MEELMYIFFGVVIFITIFDLIVDVVFAFATKKIITDVVTDKERQDGYYIIYGEKQVYKNADNWVFNKFTSSNFQARIKKGKEYEFTVVGLRLPWLSGYQNIIKYKES